MDISQPIRSVVPTLDGPVLAVLARTTRALTVSEIHRLAETGSENGVRKVLARLTKEGTVHADVRTVATFYKVNREHLAWSAIETLSSLRSILLQRTRAELDTWSPTPIHASLFGSAARSDSDARSDIDILLVRPDDVTEDHESWANQVDRIRNHIEAWTGNNCHIFQLDRRRLAEHVRADDALVDELLRDEVPLIGAPLRTILRQTSYRGKR